MHFYLEIQGDKQATCILCGERLIAQTPKGVFHCPQCVPTLDFKVTEKKKQKQ